MSYNELSEQEQLRRNSLAALRELGIKPYPAAEYPVTATAAEIADNFDPEKGNFQQVSIAGRIMGRRIMGSASFFELQDHTAAYRCTSAATISVPKVTRPSTTRIQKTARHRRLRRREGLRFHHPDG